MRIQQGKEATTDSERVRQTSSSENLASEYVTGADDDDNNDDNENSDDDINMETRSDIVVIKSKSDNSYDVFENINLDDETKGLLFGNSIDQKVKSQFFTLSHLFFLL